MCLSNSISSVRTSVQQAGAQSTLHGLVAFVILPQNVIPRSILDIKRDLATCQRVRNELHLARPQTHLIQRLRQPPWQQRPHPDDVRHHIKTARAPRVARKRRCDRRLDERGRGGQRLAGARAQVAHERVAPLAHPQRARVAAPRLARRAERVAVAPGALSLCRMLAPALERGGILRGVVVRGGGWGVERAGGPP